MSTMEQAVSICDRVIICDDVDNAGRMRKWLKADFSAMPFHVQIVQSMMSRASISLLHLGALGCEGLCNLSVGPYTLSLEISTALNAQLQMLCRCMQKDVADADQIPPCWSSIICVQRSDAIAGTRATYSCIPTDVDQHRFVLIFDDFEVHTIHGVVSGLKWCSSSTSSSSSSPPPWMF